MNSYQNTKKILQKAIIKINDELVQSVNSLNRVSSTDIYSRFNYPSGDNSSFDGYAINSNDTKNIRKNKPKHFKIIGLIAAGKNSFKKKVKKFDAVEIMTGGIVPKGFDTIIPIEQIKFYSNKENKRFILIDKKIIKHNNVRLKGSDYKKNDLVIKKNTIIQPKHILALKTLGITKINVKKKINIFFFFNWQ